MLIDKTRPIRVLHIASGDLWAGAEVQLFTLARALNSIDTIVVDIVLLNHGILEQKLLDHNINVTVVDESKQNSLSILHQIITIIRQKSPDIVHTHRVKENILGSIAARLAGNLPNLRTSHGAPEHVVSWKQLPKIIIQKLDWFCGCYLQNAIIAVSADLSDKLQKNFPAKKIHVIENGVDLQQIASQCSDTEKKANIHFDIAFAGRLVLVKRVDIFIKIAHQLLDEEPNLNIRFHIYGDGPLRKNLELLNLKLKTDTIVTFHGHKNNIMQHIQGMDALLITSDHEGLPMILLEAMALGLPIISHAIGGIPQLLDHGRCGILIDKNEATEYAPAIKQLVNNPEKISIITQLAKQRVQKDYSAKKNAQAYLSQYEDLR